MRIEHIIKTGYIYIKAIGWFDFYEAQDSILPALQ